MNPHAHPHGGGEGRSGVGMNIFKSYFLRKASPWGKTRQQKKIFNRLIVQRKRRKGILVLKNVKKF